MAAAATAPVRRVLYEDGPCVRLSDSCGGIGLALFLLLSGAARVVVWMDFDAVGGLMVDRRRRDLTRFVVRRSELVRGVGVVSNIKIQTSGFQSPALCCIDLT